MEEGRGGLLSAGGILSIISGAFQIIVGAMAVLSELGIIFPPPSYETGMDLSRWMIVAGAILVGLGIVAVSGGVSAVRRNSFGLSIAGAICSLPCMFFGILSIIFVGLGKREF